MGTFAPSPTQPPVDLYVGVRKDIGMGVQEIMNHQMYVNGTEKWNKFIYGFCDSLNLLCGGKLPNEFHKFISETILKKYSR